MEESNKEKSELAIELGFELGGALMEAVNRISELSRDECVKELQILLNVIKKCGVRIDENRT
jgi:hypothetical protein